MSRRVLITGAGSGLGRALALRYASAGCTVGCADIRLDRAEAVRAEIERSGGRAIAFPVDIADDASWAALHEAVFACWERLDVLINNAGVSSAGTLVDTSMDDWRWMVDVNLLGVVRGCRTFVPHLMAQRAGLVVNVASFAALAGAPGMASYAVAKAGVVALSEALRAELHPYGVQVTVACPAFFRTQLLENMRCSDPRLRAYAERQMERSGVRAEDVAAAIHRAGERGEFMVIPTARERRMWRAKRWMPERYFRRLVETFARRTPRTNGGDASEAT